GINNSLLVRRGAQPSFLRWPEKRLDVA
ncbi:MAG: autoinducer synthase, partial [Mesorhizobium sp.]